MQGVLIEVNNKKDILVYVPGDTDNRWIATENYPKISVVPNIHTMEDIKMDDGDVDVLTMEMQSMYVVQATDVDTPVPHSRRRPSRQIEGEDGKVDDEGWLSGGARILCIMRINPVEMWFMLRHSTKHKWLLFACIY